MSVAQRRLDEEFAVASSDVVRPAVRDLVRNLEFRFQKLEAGLPDPADEIGRFLTLIRERINETMLPKADDIMIAAAKGFLLARSETELTLVNEQGALFIIDEGTDRDLFHSTPFIAIQRPVSEFVPSEGEEPTPPPDAIEQGWALARTDAYDRKTGSLLVTVIRAYGNVGPARDWTISALAGMTEMTRLHYERSIQAAKDAAEAAARVAADRAYVESVRRQLETSGLDPNLFVDRLATRGFTGRVKGVAPYADADDDTVPTAAWTRAAIVASSYLIGEGAPQDFNTFAKVALAYGNDPNLAASIFSRINAKLDKAGGTVGSMGINGTLSVNYGGWGLHYNLKINASMTLQRGNGQGVAYLGTQGGYIHWDGGQYYLSNAGTMYGTWNLDPNSWPDNGYNRVVGYAQGLCSNIRMVWGYELNFGGGGHVEYDGSICCSVYDHSGWSVEIPSSMNARFRHVQYHCPSAGWLTAWRA